MDQNGNSLRRSRRRRGEAEEVTREGTRFLPLDNQGVNMFIPIGDRNGQLERSAVAGLTLAPRIDGMRLARLVAASRTAAAPARVAGSAALIP